MAAAKKKTAAKKSTPKAVATKEETGLATSSEGMDDLLALGKMGTESLVGPDMMTIPRIKILQALSPECTAGDPEQVEGAFPGMFYDKINGTLISGEEGFEALVIHHNFTHIEWKLRTRGGGLVQSHGNRPDLMTPAVVRKDSESNKMIVIDRPDNHIVPTHEFLLLILIEDEWKPFMLSTNPSTITSGKNLNSQYGMFRYKNQRVPSFTRSYNLVTSVKSFPDGTCFIWKSTPSRLITEIDPDKELGLIEMCKELNEGMNDDATQMNVEPISEDDPAQESDDI